MQAQSHGFISRSSSTSLSLADRPAYVPGESVDDLAITQSLLDGPNHLGKHLLVHEAPFSFDGFVGQDDSSDSQHNAPINGRNRRGFGTSNTWTSSSGEMLSEQDEVDDRLAFVQEFNRLAVKHGVRSMVVEDSPVDVFDPYGKPGSWFSRKILRRTSSSSSLKLKSNQPLRHKRSISDLSLRLKSRMDKLKDKDLQELIRLCGSSLLYLPSEYAFGSLCLPTCFRATAQYLVQHAPTTRGVFRIPGSHGTISLLYNHFCALDEGGDMVAGTVRSPTLPDHIPCDVHDVASTFKRFISGLPGGILGSLRLFDALISIQIQLHSDPEVTKTKQSKVRARLIALAIFTLKSQYRRELICAVFGLLCMIGRAAETSQREDERGRPLPTSDLMGYGPLGIVFGPLLVGDLLESYTMRLANPHSGLILLPISPPKSRKERQKEKQKKTKTEESIISFNTFVDKIKVANGVTEMLITHWRDVVRHMKNLKAMKLLTSHKSLATMGATRPLLRPSASDTFAIRKPPDWDGIKSNRLDGYSSPTPAARTSSNKFGEPNNDSSIQNDDPLNIRRYRSKSRPLSSQLITGSRSLSILSPTKERSREELGIEDFQPLPEEFRANQNENERHSQSSRQSKLSRKDNSSETPSKLRKPRPPQNKEGLTLSISKTRLRDAEDSPSIRSIKTTNDRTLGSPEGGLSLQRHRPHLVKPGLLNATSRLLHASGGSRLSKEAHIPEGLVSRQIRRIAASEPSKNPASLGSPRRLFSKSLHVDSLGRVQKTKVGARSKDPLSSVSQADDIASLKALAQFLKNEEAGDTFKLLDGTLQPRALGEPSTEFQREDIVNSRFSKYHNSLTTASSSPVSSYPRKNQWDKVSSTFSIRGQTSSETKDLSYDYVIKGPPPTPKHITSSNSPIKRFGSPGHNVKALAAKFNTVSTDAFESPTKLSPIKSPIKNTSPIQLRRDTLVAEYTTNTPSPTRSQKSAVGEKTPQPTRKLLGEMRPLSRPVNTRRKTLTPKHSSNEISSLSSTSEPFPAEKLLQTSVYKSSHPATNDPFFSLRTFDGHESSQVSHPANHGDSIQDYGIPGSSINTGSTVFVNDALLEPTESPHVHFASFDFSGRSEDTAGSGETNIESTHQHTISRSDSLSHHTTLSGTPVFRSSSVLHTKILDLQKQLNAKCEEVRQLRQQLDARATLDIGTLSEQLREAKKEILSWKSRAEISEMQVEMLSKRTIGKALSMRTLPKKTSASSIKYSENDSKGAEKSRRALGMDGAGNSRNWTSDETTGTVIRDVMAGACESDYSS